MKNKMKWEYGKLKGKIKEIYGTQEVFSKKIGISTTSLNYKLNNQIQFRQEEIYIMINALYLKDSEIKIYFFTPSVEFSQPKSA